MGGEEKHYDLDDWRDYTNNSSIYNKNILEQIDQVQQKIDSFTKQDMENNWTTVQRYIHTLQSLKVESLVAWLNDTKALPNWMSPKLKDVLLCKCEKYIELDRERKEAQNAWSYVLGSDESLNMSLDHLYSDIRKGIAKVKYSHLENDRRRHKLEFYASWLDRYKCKKLEDLVNKGLEKVDEVNEAIDLFINVFQSNQKEDQIQDASAILDKLREEVRVNSERILECIRKSRRMELDPYPFFTNSKRNI